MPKTVSVAMKTHLAGEVTTLATCWALARRDGQNLFFTDHDEDLVVGGDTYVAALGYTRSAMTMNVDFSIDNIQIAGIIDDLSLTEDDLRAGLWDFAELKMFLVNYADLTMGMVKLRRGRLGDVSSTPSGMFQTQMNGMGQILAHTVGEIFTALCAADLGDARCGIDLTLGNGFTFAGNVLSVTDTSTFVLTAPGSPSPDGWFDGGVITWTSGLNEGRSIEVKSWTSGSATAVLFLPMPRPIQVGDTFTIYPGCDKKPITCRDKFNNIVNQRGFPFIPGIDAVLVSPTTLQG